MNNKLKNWLVAILIAIILVIIDRVGYFNWLKRPVANIINPSRHKLYLNKVSNPSESELASGQAAILEAELKTVLAENERLRDLLGTKLPPSWQFVPANILNINNNQITIDVGSDMQVSSGMVVIGLKRNQVNNGLVIGQVVDVGLSQSKVRVLQDKDSRLNGITEAGVKGLVGGQGDKVSFKEVLQEYQLVENELVLTAGGDGWPPGLVIGRIGTIDKVDTEVFQSAEINLLIDLSSLRQVYIVSL